MDLEDNETAMNSFDSQAEELKATIKSLEANLAHNQTQMSDMEARLEDSRAQVEPPSYTKVYPNHFVPQMLDLIHFHHPLELNILNLFSLSLKF